jgi:hypothetical protein
MAVSSAFVISGSWANASKEALVCLLTDKEKHVIPFRYDYEADSLSEYPFSYLLDLGDGDEPLKMTKKWE